ncbi:MAG: class II aldolase [Eubacterium sp.]|nr:class II aldolase [Eubacterium sp.]
MLQKDLTGFLEMSKYAGMREDLVQAGGGNSSYKYARDRMVIKASGYQLADLTMRQGYVVVNPQIIAEAFWQDHYAEGVTQEKAKGLLKKSLVGDGRPSIETFLHAVTAAYTLHTHPIAVNALTCRQNGRDILYELFPEALFVPYASPGAKLAAAFFKAYQESGKDASVVFLQNHGLVVSAQDAHTVMEKTEQVVKKAEDYLEADFTRYHHATKLYQILGHGVVWTVTDQYVLDAYQACRAAGVVWEQAFCPDCVVFLGKKMCEAGDDFDRAALEKFSNAYGKPVVFSYKNALYISAESVRKALEIQSILSFNAQILSLNQGCACHLLSESEQDFLLNWEAEKYRAAGSY